MNSPKLVMLFPSHEARLFEQLESYYMNNSVMCG